MSSKLPFDAELIEAREITDGVVFSREWFVLVRDPKGKAEPINIPLPGATKETALTLAIAAVRALATEHNWS